MDFNQIRGFLAVAETLHFTRAAERVHLSQPALSIQIRDLEKELGLRLFERSHQRTTLTAAGQSFYEEICDIPARLEHTIGQTRRAAAGQIGRVRLGFISTAAAHIIPPLVAEFGKTHPDVELSLLHALTSEQIDMLESRTLDIGFFRVPIVEHSKIRTITIHEEPFKLFLPARHPLAGRDDLSPRDLDGADLVVYARRNAPGFHDLLLSLLRAAGATPATIHEANDMYTLVSLVSAGVGMAIAPASVAHYGMPDVSIHALAGTPPSQIALAFHCDCFHPAARAFIDMTTASSGYFIKK